MARVFAHEAWHKCEEQGVNGRYEMILLAAQRARQLSRGLKPIVEETEERGQALTVNALRDFETGQLDMSEIKEDLIKSMQKVSAPSIEISEE